MYASQARVVNPYRPSYSPMFDFSLAKQLPRGGLRQPNELFGLLYKSNPSPHLPASTSFLVGGGLLVLSTGCVVVEIKVKKTKGKNSNV